MTDPKARKVIVVENTFLPAYVKDEIAKSLFENLKVSFGFSSRASSA
jgi:actin-related protein 10